ncbi:hypothetical protein EJ02DRAFT_418544 [Clathrospora elynae]|uniref:F-box domain-containing protein n=1 Tax=Clathrospora elynae TaxID=706981 RepID=A0A6A5T6P3_9PLEO|nr:hypothetical protein EJ02DRAFT_418544 [Clathrospora elynae]
MAGLLDLPSELLFEIIHLVATSPIVLQEKGVRHRPATYSTRRKLLCVPSLDLLRTPNALNLLLINQRMYSETEDYLSKKPQFLKLDVAIVNDHWIWPTWRSVPLRPSKGIVDTVEINLVHCWNEDDWHPHTSWAPHSVEDVCPLLGFLLDGTIGMVESILQLCSPASGGKLKDSAKYPITRINTLMIRIDTSRYGDGNQILSDEQVPLRKIDGLAHLDFDRLHPDDYEKSSLYMSNLETFMFEQLNKIGWETVSRRLGSLVFCFDGEIRQGHKYWEDRFPGE